MQAVDSSQGQEDRKLISVSKVKGNAAWHKRFHLSEKHIWIACILPCRDASTLSEWARVQVFSLESQTVSLAPECSTLFISQQQRCVLGLGCRISSDPCESVRDDFQCRAPRHVSLYVSYLLLFVPALLALCPEAYNTDIVPTERRGGAGGKVERRRITWQRAAKYVL